MAAKRSQKGKGLDARIGGQPVTNDNHGKLTTQVAPWPQVDQFPTILGSNLTISYIASVYRLATQGYRQQYVDALNELLEKDPQTQATLGQRVLAVAGGRVELTPAHVADPKSQEAKRAKEIRDDLQRRVDAIPRRSRAFYALVFSQIYYGAGAVEVLWDPPRADGWWVRDLGFIHSRRISAPDFNDFSPHIWDQGAVQPLTWGIAPTERLFGLRMADWPGKFIFLDAQVRADYWLREGVGRVLGFWMAIKLVAIRGAGQFVERFGKPWVTATYATGEEGFESSPRAATTADIAQADATIAAFGAGSIVGAVIPDSIKVALDGPAIKGTAGGINHEKLIEICDAQISKAVRGSTLTTDTGPNGNRSLGEVHAEGDVRNARYDASCLADALKEQLVWWLCHLNFPGEEHLCPGVTVHVENISPEQMLERAIKFAAVCGALDAVPLAEQLGLKLVDPTDPQAIRLAPLKPSELFAVLPSAALDLTSTIAALCEMVGIKLTPATQSAIAEMDHDDAARFIQQLLGAAKAGAKKSSAAGAAEETTDPAAAEGEEPDGEGGQPAPAAPKPKKKTPAGPKAKPGAKSAASSKKGPQGPEEDDGTPVAARDWNPSGEAPADAPMGCWAWPELREGCPGTEPANEVEARLFKSIRQHFRSDHVGLPREDAELLTEMLAAGQYPIVMHPPPQPTLYRGIKLRSRAELAELLGIPETALADDGSLELGRAVPVENGCSTSWTAKKRITTDFSATGKRGFAVTFVADTAANPNRFLAGPGGLYDVVGLSQYHLEKETVGLEPVVVRRVEWTRIEPDT